MMSVNFMIAFWRRGRGRGLSSEGGKGNDSGES